MGKETGIEWTDHTLNFWWGCLKVSPGCTNCYAETFSKRTGRNIWGPAETTERWRTKGPWRDCLKWDRKAGKDGVRRRVFSQSMSDFFEDHPQVEPWRQEAFDILEGFRNLDVQLLTKRVENVREMVPGHWLKNWPAHIWIGTSVENQEWADKRIPELLKIPAKVRFLSCEPLIGQVDLCNISYGDYLLDCLNHTYGSRDRKIAMNFGMSKLGQVGWVILGGESGPSARPSRLGWYLDLVYQCEVAGVPVFMKQLGQKPLYAVGKYLTSYSVTGKGGHPEEWPKELRVRQFPSH